MANLSIRKLDDETYKKLQIRAVNHGISMEEEVRRIIIKATAEPENITTIFKKCFGPKKGIDIDFQSQRKPHNPIEFE